MKQTTVHMSIVILSLCALLFTTTEISAQASLPAPSPIAQVVIGGTEADMSALRVSWPAITGGTRYWLQVSSQNTTAADGSFICTVGATAGSEVQICSGETDAVGHPTTNGWLTTTSADIYNLTCNTTYYVHVKAASDAEESPWSQIYSFTTASCPNLSPVPVDKPGWELTFQDEFDGRELDTSKWNKQNRSSALQSQLQAFLPDAFEVQKGILRIRTDTRIGEYGWKTQNYTSGAMVTAGKFDQQYGYYEIRTRMPKGSDGLRVSFWLRPVMQPQPHDEIDIYEFVGIDPDTVINFTYHFPQLADGSTSENLRYKDGPDYTADYHTVGVDWNPQNVIWYVDGSQVFVTSNYTHIPMFVLVTMPVEGGNPFTIFPNYYDIDYIRVYRKDDGTVASPYIGPTKDARVFADSAYVILETSTLGSVVYYTLDGSDPTPASQLYTSPFTLTTSKSVKAIAIKNAVVSSISTADFTVIPSTTSLPLPWQETNIGITYTSVPTRYGSGTFVVSGDGAAIGNVYDSFHYVYQQVSGDSDLVARILNLDPTHPEAKAGIMIRKNLSRDSPFAMIDVTPRKGIEWIYRQQAGDVAALIQHPELPDYSWLKMTKQGSKFEVYASQDGINWGASIGSKNFRDIELENGPFYVGLAVASRFNANAATAAIDSVALTGQACTLLGDITADNQRDLSDVVRCIRYLLGLETLTANELATADVTQDGLLDLSDVIRSIRDLLGLEPLPVCQ